MDGAGRATRGLVRSAVQAVVAFSGAVFVVAEFSIYRVMLVLVFYAGFHLVSARTGASLAVGVVGLGVLASSALVEYPDGSDMWIYHSYGRMIVEHGANPYVRVPSDFGDDGLIGRVLPMYRDSPSVYGPVLVAEATVIAAMAGDSGTAARVLWQGMSLFVVVLTALCLWRRGVDRARVWLFASSPIVVYQLVNQAHIDGLIGLLVGAGCIAADRRRVVTAAVLMALATMVKAPLGIALIIYVVWQLANRQNREALVTVSTAAIVALVAMAPFGIGNVVRPMLDAGDSVNATTIWNLVRGDVDTFLWNPIRSNESSASTILSTVSMLIPVVVAVVAAYVGRNRPVYAPITTGLLAWFVLSLHSSVWYLGWVMPLFALWNTRRSNQMLAYSSLALVTSISWLMPVAAAMSGDGELDFADRLAAPLLGITSAFGVWLVARTLVDLRGSGELG